MDTQLYCAYSKKRSKITLWFTVQLQCKVLIDNTVYWEGHRDKCFSARSGKGSGAVGERGASSFCSPQCRSRARARSCASAQAVEFLCKSL